MYKAKMKQFLYKEGGEYNLNGWGDNLNGWGDNSNEDEQITEQLT